MSLGTTAAWAAFGYAILKLAVFATFAVLVAVRGESERANRDRLAIVSCIAAFASLAFLRAPSADDGGLAQVLPAGGYGFYLQWLGMAAAVWISQARAIRLGL